MCCLDPVLRLTTRFTGRAWRSVSRRFFFCFVSPRLVLLFHSFRTISLRFGESRLLPWLAHLSPSLMYSSSPLPVSLTGSNDSRSGLCYQVAYLFKLTSGDAEPWYVRTHSARECTTVGQKKTSCLRVNAGREERPKRTLRGSKPHLLFICSSAFATKAFISVNETTRERSRNL